MKANIFFLPDILLKYGVYTRHLHCSLIRRFDTYLKTWATIRFRDHYFYFRTNQYDLIRMGSATLTLLWRNLQKSHADL